MWVSVIVSDNDNGYDYRCEINDHSQKFWNNIRQFAAEKHANFAAN